MKRLFAAAILAGAALCFWCCARRSTYMCGLNAYETYEGFFFPVIPVQGKKLSDFTPAGWTAEDTIYEDLNNDGKEDALLLLTYPDTTDQYEYPAGVMNYQIFDQHILLLLYKKRNGYIQNTYCYKLLNAHGGMGQPDFWFETDPGKLCIALNRTGNGSYTVYYTYVPQPQTGRWVLLRVEEESGNAEYTANASYDFVSDSLHIHTWNMEYDEETDSVLSESYYDLDTIAPLDTAFYLDRMEYGDCSPQYLLSE